MMYNFRKNKQGFSLAEVLVVLTIIGMLTSVVLSSIDSAKSKSRDFKRQADMDALNKALIMYYVANNKYPSYNDGACSWVPEFSSFRPVDGCLNVLVSGGYISKLPIPRAGEYYYYDNWCDTLPGVNPKQFRVWAYSENDQGPRSTGWWSPYVIGISPCADPI